MKHAPWTIIGTVDTGDSTTDLLSVFMAQTTMEVTRRKALGTYTIEEVAKHNNENDAWVTIQGDVLNVTDFLLEHPGGKLVILNLAGKDASDEFLSIHPADVYRKHAPYLIIGSLQGYEKKDYHLKANKNDGKTDSLLAKEPEDEGVIGGWFGSMFYAAYAIMNQVISTIFTASNVQFLNDRTGLTRSACFMMFFMVIHAVGNLHIFLGPDDFNGYGYFYVRLYWTMGGLVEANAVEIYLAMAIVLHVSVALKRTWDINRKATWSSGKLNLAFTGVLLLTFMTLHLFQFRLADTEKYLVRPPPWYYGGINWPTLLKLQLFWSADETIKPVPVRDIYKLEFDLFSHAFWCLYYIFSAGVFLAHACWGWQKLVPASSMAIPKPQRNKVVWYGWLLMGFVACCYFSFPLYCYFMPMKTGALGHVG